ncbi:hypothetical protein BGZ60DRAFT_397692 [Tricladium varicosporioides]|nr:hypothetical protein BGZ60DRAFT_397692 [Hymenoscyphus varicosporioides]
MTAIPPRLDTLLRAITEEDNGIFTVLINYLQPSSKLTTSEVMQKIDEISMAETSRDEPDKDTRSHSCFIESFWGVMIHVTRQLPNEDVVRKKLVNLIVALCASSNAESEHYMWHDDLLGGLDAIAETWRGPEFVSKEGKSMPTEKEISGWILLNSIIASVWGAVGNVHQTLTLFHRMAILELRQALEGRQTWLEPSRSEEHKVNGVMDMELAVVAEWMEHAGSLIYGACCEGDGADIGEPRSFGSNHYASGELYTGTPGLCLERWAFWEKRFGDICTEEGVSDTSRALAFKSILNMKQVKR